MKVLYYARVCRSDLLFAVCFLAREVTRWTRACDKRMHRLISYIQGTKTLSLYSTVGDPLYKCRLLLHTDADFAGSNADLSKSTSGLLLAMAGPNTFAPLLDVSKAQSATSHSSTESEVISLEYALRTEGMPALDFWDAVAPLYSTTSRSSRGTLATQKQGKGSSSKVDDREVGGIQHNFRLTVCEDNEATIKIVLKRRSPAMRHISRTHRVNLDWVYEAFQQRRISLRYVRTTSQVADVLTKHFVKREIWDALLTMCFSRESVDWSFSGGPETHSTTQPKSTNRNIPCSRGA